MSNPTTGDAKVDKLLSQFSQKYINPSYIALSIAPELKVVEKTGKFAKYGFENLRPYVGQILRAPGTRANSVDYSVSMGDYSCTEKSLEKRIPDELKNNTDKPYDAEKDAVATLLDNMLVNQEYALAQVMTNASVLTQNYIVSGTSQWNETSYVSTPLQDIEDGIDTIQSATGQRPNSVTMSFAVMRALKAHPEVREQVKYTNGGQLSEGSFVTFMKEYFMLDNVYIGTAVYNSADEGQTASISSVWGNDLVLFYQTPRPTLGQATFAYTFTDQPRVVEKYREESHVSDVARVRYSYDQNIMDVSLAYLIKSAIA